MPIKNKFEKEVKCKCGINTIVKYKPAENYSKNTLFICECGTYFYVRDYNNGMTTFLHLSKAEQEREIVKAEKAEKEKEGELTDIEIEKMLNPDDKSVDWPEIETIMDDVREFMTDLPLEVFEHLFRAVHKEKEELIQHLLSFSENKKCFNKCPKCGSGDMDIEWGDKDWSLNEAWQQGICQKCDCYFMEHYVYNHTEIVEGI